MVKFGNVRPTCFNTHALHNNPFPILSPRLHYNNGKVCFLARLIRQVLILEHGLSLPIYPGAQRVNRKSNLELGLLVQRLVTSLLQPIAKEMNEVTTFHYPSKLRNSRFTAH